jgi:hypothetical protein
MFHNDLIGPKLYMNNHWMVPNKVFIFSVDQQSEMAVKVCLIRKETIYYNLLWKYWVNLIIQDQIWPDMPGIFLWWFSVNIQCENHSFHQSKFYKVPLNHATSSWIKFQYTIMAIFWGTHPDLSTRDYYPHRKQPLKDC